MSYLNNIKIITIPGVPDVKMRPRFNKRTGHAYDPNTGSKEASIQKATVEGETRVFTLPLTVTYLFVFPRPKSHYGSGKNASVLKPSAPRHCTNVKDLDNLEKFYADSFNFIHYEDDRQIVTSMATKRWARLGEQPFVRMSITELTEE